MERQELEKTAELALLNLSEGESERLQAAIGRMLEYFALMDEIDVTTLEPTTHALQTKNRTRKDEPVRYSDTDGLLENAEDTEERFIVIPNVI